MDVSDAASLNNRLRQERMRHNWRQCEVADQVGATVVTVNRWERGICQPSAYFRVKLCNLFGKSAEELGILSEELPLLIPKETKASAPLETFPLSTDFSKQQDADTRPDEDITYPLTYSAFLHDTSQSAHITMQQYQSRERMLRRLRHAYSALQAQLMQGTDLIKLELSQKPDAVCSTANFLCQSIDKAEYLLPPSTSIIQAYEDADHELLILGEPGTGKSMLLLDLAQQLVKQAEIDTAHPLPVILPLSSWAVKRPALEDWVGERLTQFYNVPVHMAQQWIKEGQILLLLDGLDEMKATARSACIAAINAYHRAYLTPLVVCSREVEYDLAAAQQRLTLHQAIVVQPLTVYQVKAYLTQRGKPLVALCQVLEEDPTLQELATTPLMLNVLSDVYRGISLCNLPTVSDQLKRQVWANYIEQMVTYKGNQICYSPQQTRSWLGWLAKQMRTHNQTIFYPKHLQPDCLPANELRIYTWLAVRLPGILIGILAIVLMQLLLNGRIIAPSFLFLGGLLGGLWSSPVLKKSALAVHAKIPLQVWTQRIAPSLFTGLLCGICVGFNLASSYPNHAFSYYLQCFFYSGSTTGVVCFLLQSFFVGNIHRSIPGSKRTRRWRRLVCFLSIQRALLAATVLSLSFGLGNELMISSLSDSSVAANYEMMHRLSNGLMYGFVGMLLGLTITKQVHTIQVAERAQLSWRALRRSLFASKYLFFTCLIVLLIGLEYGLNQAAKGVSQAFNVESFGVTLNYVSGVGMTTFLRVLLPGISIGCWVWFLSSGLSIWRHIVLRICLWRARVFPMKILQFLDDASARILLRRIGGGYSFTYAPLQNSLEELSNLTPVDNDNS